MSVRVRAGAGVRAWACASKRQRAVGARPSNPWKPTPCTWKVRVRVRVRARVRVRVRVSLRSRCIVHRDDRPPAHGAASRVDEPLLLVVVSVAVRLALPIGRSRVEVLAVERDGHDPLALVGATILDRHLVSRVRGPGSGSGVRG